MSEKEKLKERSTRQIYSNVDEVTLFVDLDDPVTKVWAERGLTVVSLHIVQGGKSLFAQLDLETFGKKLDLSLEANRARRLKSNVVEISVDMARDGYPLEVPRGKK